MISSTAPRLRFTAIFQAGDTLFRAERIVTNAEGTVSVEEIYAYSDGTRPYECDEGPYLIDVGEIMEAGVIWLVPSSLRGSPLVGAVPSVNGAGKSYIGRPTMGVTMELARRLGITEFGVFAEYKSGTREPGVFRLRGKLS